MLHKRDWSETMAMWLYFFNEIGGVTTIVKRCLSIYQLQIGSILCNLH